MNDEKLVLYESLIRASLMLIFSVALLLGTLGLIVISKTLMQQTAAQTQFVAIDRQGDF